MDLVNIDCEIVWFTHVLSSYMNRVAVFVRCLRLESYFKYIFVAESPKNKYVKGGTL